MNFAEMHEIAVHTAKDLRSAELRMITILQAIDATNGFRELGFTSLSAYMIGALSFSGAGAHHFITVCRKAVKVPELQAALHSDQITISKAKTIAPVLTRENAARWLELAKKHTVRELERAVAQEHPEVMRIERVRHRAKDQVDLSVTVREATMDLIQRAQEILRQNKNASVPIAEVLHELAEAYLERKDPLRKATKKKPASRTEKEKALLRDNGACQYKLADGKRCLTRYWLDLHHLKPRAEGGSDKAENLITLCSAHHRMMHGPPTAT